MCTKNFNYVVSITTRTNCAICIDCRCIELHLGCLCIMAEQLLPPPHPSLPMAPHARVALAVTAALSNPYSQPPLVQYRDPSQYQPAISSHYAQAYMDFPTAPTTTPRGNGPADPSSARRNAFGSQNRQSSQSTMLLHTSAAWYQPGNSKCTFEGCSFTASPKTLEIHMMDRHLIYPLGWEKRQKKPDWDADPSLKGSTYTLLPGVLKG